MGEVTQEVNIEMRKKLPDGNYRVEYPKTKIEQVAGRATKAEAEAGIDDTKYMTPVRVKDSLYASEAKVSVFNHVQRLNQGRTKVSIPLGKVPRKYIKLTSVTGVMANPYFFGTGELYIDVVQGVIYAKELLMGGDSSTKFKSTNERIDDYVVDYPTFGKYNSGTTYIRGETITINNSTLEWEFYCNYDSNTLTLNNLLVEVL